MLVMSINIGCRFQGIYGPFLPAMCNPDGTQVKRRKWQLLEGVIVESQGEKKWLVSFDGGLEKECPSVGLKLLFDPRYRSGATSSLIAAAAPIKPQAPLPIEAAPPFEPQEPIVQHEPVSIAAAPPIQPQTPSSITVTPPIPQQAVEEMAMEAAAPPILQQDVK